MKTILTFIFGAFALYALFTIGQWVFYIAIGVIATWAGLKYLEAISKDIS